MLINIRYNKAEKDFPTLLEYNNYLEEVEDISEFDLPPLLVYIRIMHASHLLPEIPVHILER